MSGTVWCIMLASFWHLCLGLASIIIGMINTVKAEVWMAHTVSPIWSGTVFFLNALVGLTSLKYQTEYVINCYTASSMVSFVTSLVSIQLLRFGLVIYSADGEMYRKERLDTLIITALSIAIFECINCILGAIASLRLAKLAKKQLIKRQNGLFHIIVFDEKDVMVITKDQKITDLKCNFCGLCSSCFHTNPSTPNEDEDN